MNSLNTLLPNIFSLIEKDELDKANEILLKAFIRFPTSADLHNLQALVAKKKNDIKDQFKYLTLSLEIAPKQTNVIIQLATLHYITGSFKNSEALYKKGLEFYPDDLKMLYNYALTLKKLNKLSLALSTLNRAINIMHCPPNIYILLGNIYQQLGESQKAVSAYDLGLTLHPTHAQLVICKTTSLRLEGNISAGKSSIMLINKNKADQEPYLFQSALLFIENEEHELAIEYLIKLIEINPLSFSAHELLNKIYWEQAEYEYFLLSYKNSILKYPKCPDLYFSYIAMCLMACKYSEARQALSITNKLGFNSHQFIHLEGVISVKEGDLDKALLFFDKALSLAPNFVRYSIDKANILMQKKEIVLAEMILRNSLKLEPYNQEVIGYLGLCWKLIKHPKLNWLSDYKKFICVSKLDTPNGYSSFSSFWEELKSEISALHISTHQPLDQSVRNGTQTSGMLHVTKTKVIQDYQNALRLRICEYLTDLPRDLSHPFLARNTKNFYFSGSWSVKLGNDGYHSNHLHPKSWLSTCTYINVPNNINYLDSNKFGWLKFGESNLSLGNTDKPDLEICPEEGLCVIFPAYFWHGTNPIKTEGIDNRLTALCDIEPLFG